MNPAMVSGFSAFSILFSISLALATTPGQFVELIKRQAFTSKIQELTLYCDQGYRAGNLKGVLFSNELNVLFICNTTRERILPSGRIEIEFGGNPDADLPRSLFEGFVTQRVIPIYLDGLSDPQISVNTLERQPSLIGPIEVTALASANDRFRLLEGFKEFYDDCRRPVDFVITSVNVAERFPSDQVSFTYSQWYDKVRDSDLGLLSFNELLLFNTRINAACRISNDQFVKGEFEYVGGLGARLVYLTYDRIVDQALTSVLDLQSNLEIFAVAKQFAARSTEHTDWMTSTFGGSHTVSISGRIHAAFVSRVRFDARNSTFTEDLGDRNHCFSVCPMGFKDGLLYRNGLTIMLRLLGIENVMLGQAAFLLDSYNVQQFEKSFLTRLKSK